MSLTWPFVGREGELQLIRDAMASGTSVVLAGAPGVGKTRLAYEAIVTADPQRYLTIWTAATAATTPIPLGAFAPLLSADVPTSPVALLRAATDALLDRCGSRRLVLGVDDAHLLDEISATLVHQLARTRRVFVLASLRSRHPMPDPIRALWKDALASRVEVAALSQSGTTDALVAALSGQVDGVTSRRLWRAARGNMLFLRELVDAGIDSGALTECAGVWRWAGPWVTTPRLAELISDRIGRLEQAEQEVLEIVAYGEPIGADLLMSMADRHTVEAVESRELLWARQDGRRVDVRLAHPLYGDVLRAGCSPQRSAVLRRRLADAVEATGARRKDDWLRIATWRLDAAAPVRPDVLVAAAGRAFALLDLPLAERLARTAFELYGDPAAGAVLWRVLFLSERSAETEEVLARLAGTVQSDGTSDSQRGDYAIGRAGNLFWGLHRVDEAFALLRATRDGITDPLWRDEIDLVLCAFQLLQADLGAAQRGLADLQARTGLSPRAAAQLPVLQGMALVHVGRLGLARDVLDLAAEPLARWAEEVPWVAETRRVYRCYAALFAGRLAEAGELATALHTHAVQTEWDFAVRLSCGVQAQVARLRGRVRTAARWAREGLRLGGNQGNRRHAPFLHHVFGELAHAEALAGRGVAALAAVQEADDRPPASETLLQPWVELARPWIAVAAGDQAGAMRLAAAAAEYARAHHAAGFEAFALHDTVRLGAARTAVDRLDELAETLDSDLVQVFATHARAAADGDPAGIEGVGAAFVALGADLLAAEAYVQAAHGYQRFGTSASDRRLRTQAALLLDRCEGARTPLVAGIEVPQLTPRERDIAQLAAEGLSNLEIADRMVISSRTVGNHLHHVYVKLGIGGRSDLAALLGAEGT
ncbi:MAG: LuxR C-terminal-related transcriptional regulator [Pseudonocardiaceae bacterium]